jgi:hypothetical protein
MSISPAWVAYAAFRARLIGEIKNAPSKPLKRKSLMNPVRLGDREARPASRAAGKEFRRTLLAGAARQDKDPPGLSARCGPR